MHFESRVRTWYVVLLPREARKVPILTPYDQTMGLNGLFDLFFRDFSLNATASPPSLVPTLRVVRAARRDAGDAERPGMHSHAERGNEFKRFSSSVLCQEADGVLREVSFFRAQSGEGPPEAREGLRISARVQRWEAAGWGSTRCRGRAGCSSCHSRTGARRTAIGPRTACPAFCRCAA